MDRKKTTSTFSSQHGPAHSDPVDVQAEKPSWAVLQANHSRCAADGGCLLGAQALY